MFREYNVLAILFVFSFAYFLEKKTIVDFKRRQLLTNLPLSILALLGYSFFNHFGWGIDSEASPFRFSPAHFVTTLLLLDFLAYFAHFIMHKVPILWQVHRVHHSDPWVDLTTTFRQHPFETVLRAGFQILGVFLVGSSPLELALYLGFSSVNAIFEHTQVWIPIQVERALAWIFVTPRYHKLHHSPNVVETDSNYSNIFSLWDRIFRTYTPVERADQVAYGLDTVPASRSYSFFRQLVIPFLKYDLSK